MEGIKKETALIRKPKPPQAPEQPTPITEVNLHEIIPVEKFVDDDSKWLETAKRAGSRMDVKDILRSKGKVTSIMKPSGSLLNSRSNARFMATSYGDCV